ncbi:MAG: hypothetical protein ABW321_30935, partial [Polyangiales bacterium]
LPAPREPTPSGVLVDAQQAVIKLLDGWDPALLARIVDQRAVHYPWYQTLQARLTNLTQAHGHCRADGALHADDRLSGVWKMRCERGEVAFTLDLTPTVPPRVHLLRWTELLPPDERANHVVAQLAAAIGGAPEQLQPLLAAAAPQEQIGKQLAHAAIDHGTCVPERPIAGDGHSHVGFMLACTHGPLELAIELAEDGLVNALALQKPHARDATCWQ